MKDYIEERVLELACYIIDKKTTVRVCAREYGISKSTVHKDVTDRLRNLKPELSVIVRKILEENKAIRHIRGGEATRVKYINKKTLGNV